MRCVCTRACSPHHHQYAHPPCALSGAMWVVRSLTPDTHSCAPDASSTMPPPHMTPQRCQCNGVRRRLQAGPCPTWTMKATHNCLPGRNLGLEKDPLPTLQTCLKHDGKHNTGHWRSHCQMHCRCVVPAARLLGLDTPRQCHTKCSHSQLHAYHGCLTRAAGCVHDSNSTPVQKHKTKNLARVGVQVASAPPHATPLHHSSSCVAQHECGRAAEVHMAAAAALGHNTHRCQPRAV